MPSVWTDGSDVYNFVEWEDASTNPSRTVYVTADITVIAFYELEVAQQYELNIQVDGSGTTVPAVGVHTYPEGEVVSVAATADLGWEFNHWELDTVDAGSVSPIEVTMNDDHALVAVFTEEVAIDTLKDLVTMFFEDGKISHKGMYNSFIVKLLAAEAYIDAGQIDDAKGVLGAFINHARAQSGKHLWENAANIMIAEAESLINSL